MKRTTKNLLLLLALFVCQQINAESVGDDPAWLTALRSCQIIDSIIALPRNEGVKDQHAMSYHIYYHQPLCHDEPDGETFQLRCALVVRDSVNLSKCVNEVYFSGYGIKNYWNAPDSLLLSDSFAEITQRYNGNLIIPEHRYFFESSPKNCWERLDYCNANEASQDFHALISALKTVFTGKWVITGISKGGITTAMQHAFFPDDADVYVPNSAPFCHGLKDPRMHQYIQYNGWTKAKRDRLNAMLRTLLEDNQALYYYKDSMRIPFLRDSLKLDIPKDRLDSLGWKSYYKSVMDISIGAYANVARDSVDVIMDRNEAMRNTILNTYQYFEKYFPGMSPQSVLNYFYVTESELDATKAWTAFMPQKKKNVRRAYDKCFGITQKQWRSDDDMAYHYQAIRELGRYALDMRNIYEEGTEGYTQFAEPTQKVYDEIGFDSYVDFPFFSSVKYDDYELFSMVEEKTKNAKKPILFLYGEDDSWTGAAMVDDCINGYNVRKYILAAQKHAVSINDDNTSDGTDIWEFLDYYLGDDSPEGVNTVAERNEAVANVRYNMMGQRISNASALKGLYIVNGRKYYAR